MIRTHAFEKENIMLKNHVEEMQHKHRVEIANLKMEVLKRCGDGRRERNDLEVQLFDMKQKCIALMETQNKVGLHIYFVCIWIYHDIFSKSLVRRQKGLTGYCFKYIDRPFCLPSDEM